MNRAAKSACAMNPNAASRSQCHVRGSNESGKCIGCSLRGRGWTELCSLICGDHLFISDLESAGREIRLEDDEVRATASSRRRHKQSIVSEPIHGRADGSAWHVIDT